MARTDDTRVDLIWLLGWFLWLRVLAPTGWVAWATMLAAERLVSSQFSRLIASDQFVQALVGLFPEKPEGDAAVFVTPTYVTDFIERKRSSKLRSPPKYDLCLASRRV
jgi:hypothetical protein